MSVLLDAAVVSVHLSSVTQVETRSGRDVMLYFALKSGTDASSRVCGQGKPRVLRRAKSRITGTVAFVTHEKFGLNLLRRAWVNLDLVWPVALIVDGWSGVAGACFTSSDMATAQEGTES